MYPQSMFRAKIRKISHFFHMKIVIFYSFTNFSILNRSVNIMGLDFL